MIGSNIKRLRTEHGMTQKMLADKLFVSAQAVSRWENNEVEPSIGTITELAKIFEVSTDEILGLGVAEEKEASEPEVVVEKEYVYKEAPKQQLALCTSCNRPIYDQKDIVRIGRVGPRGDRSSIICRECDEKQKKRDLKERIEKSHRRRHMSFWLGIPIALVVMFSVMAGMKWEGDGIAIGIFLGISSFTLVSCLLFDNNFLWDVVVGVASWGFVQMPGIIFSLDIDGIIAFICIKLLLAILSFLLAALCVILAFLLGCVVSVFVYPYALIKNIKHPDQIDS